MFGCSGITATPKGLFIYFDATITVKSALMISIKSRATQETPFKQELR